MKKQEALEMIKTLPAEFDTEELMHRLWLKAKLERAEAAAARGDVYTHEEVRRLTEEWYRSSGQDRPSPTSRKSTNTSPRIRRDTPRKR